MIKESTGITGKKERSGFWRKHVDAWNKESFSQAEYCRRHGLKLSVFGYWKRSFSQKHTPTEFVEVRVRENAQAFAQPASNIKLLIGDEFTIEVTDGFSCDTLRTLVCVLRDLP